MFKMNCSFTHLNITKIIVAECIIQHLLLRGAVFNISTHHAISEFSPSLMVSTKTNFSMLLFPIREFLTVTNHGLHRISTVRFDQFTATEHWKNYLLHAKGTEIIKSLIVQAQANGRDDSHRFISLCAYFTKKSCADKEQFLFYKFYVTVHHYKLTGLD